MKSEVKVSQLYIEKLLDELYQIGLEKNDDDITGYVGQVLAILRGEDNEQ